jgi:predicted amidohydrolase YtcJ
MPLMLNVLRLYAALFFVALISQTSCKNKQHADIIFHHALIYSMDENATIHEAIAVKDGKVLAIGSNDFILLNYAATQTEDLNGSAILPGLIDAHSHFLGYAKGLNEINLVGIKSVEELIEKVEREAPQVETEWIIGRGWDQNQWPGKQFPDNEKLNELFPDRPLILYRIDGHAALVNKAALTKAGINRNSKVFGGEVMLNKNSEPSGVLIDNAVDLIKKVIPPYDFERLKRDVEKAQQKLFEVGLTTVCDAGLNVEQIQRLRKLDDSGLLKMGVYAMHEANFSTIDSIINAGPYESARLKITSFKIYADGALGSRGACLLRHYHDKEGYHGLMLQEYADLQRMIGKIVASDFQVNTHCIGDSANRVVLQLYADFLKSKNDRRWRIEHAQVVNKSDVNFFSNYSIIPSVQPIHATSDMYWAEDRLGRERIQEAYAYQTLWNCNNWLASGSDFPVESINPFEGIYAAVARQDTTGFPADGFYKNEGLSIQQTLESYTRYAAKACFLEHKTGSLKPGMDADFFILKDDINRLPLNELYKLKVQRTIKAGETVYRQ